MYLIPKRYIGLADISVARKLFESCPKVAQRLPENCPETNTEMVTKTILMRAVKMPTGAFCTEFRRERFCDVDFFEFATADRSSRSRKSGLPQPIGRSALPADRADRKSQPIGRSLPADQSRSTVEWPARADPQTGPALTHHKKFNLCFLA